jgi:predicted transcriptional regulator of viral defense system
MSKLRKLNNLTHEVVTKGHRGIFCTEDLALLLGTEADDSFRKYLHTAVKAGVLKRVAKGIYCNPSAGFKEKGALEYVARLLHWNHFLYVSLESQLSHIGHISQIPFRHLTVMTTGRSARVETPFGVIEFTHTSRNPESLVDDVYFDPDTGIFRATEARAIADLKRVGRNTHLLEEGMSNA